MAAVEAPPRLNTGPIGWLRQNLFNNWYNSLLTILAIWMLYSLLQPIWLWSSTEARWIVIQNNLTLFMVGLYPRDQIWRMWIIIYMLAGLIGISWGVWKAAARGFAFIALGAGAAFALFCILVGWNTWMNWLIADTVLLAFFLIGGLIPFAGAIAGAGWLIYFPLVFLLVGGSASIPALPPVEMGLWGGLLLTLLLTVVGNIGALPLGILLALGRRSKLPIVRTFCVGYIELIRGVPLVTVLYMADILLPLFLPVDVRPDRVLRAMVGFVLFEAAYQAENVRGGLQSINRGQYEAAQRRKLSSSLARCAIARRSAAGNWFVESTLMPSRSMEVRSSPKGRQYRV